MEVRVLALQRLRPEETITPGYEKELRPIVRRVAGNAIPKITLVVSPHRIQGDGVQGAQTTDETFTL